MTTAIRELFAWEALDSRGNPTVACEVRLQGGAAGVAIVPSGASTGAHEAHELRDGGDRYGGKGVTQAVKNVVSDLASAVTGLDAVDQRGVDEALCACDGNHDLSRLGANAILSVSIATALAAAQARHQPLYRAVLDSGAAPLIPMPMVNIISGGAHAGRAIDVQDFLVVPLGANTFAEAIEWCARVRSATALVMDERGLPSTLVADEGGLGPKLQSNVAALELLAQGIERAGLVLGDDAAIALDIAATQFAESDGRYRLHVEDRLLRHTELVEELSTWCDRFPIVSIEDALAEDDWDGWAGASEALGARTQLLGDDLFVTDVERLKRGVSEGIANAVLVKPNQAGTLTRAREVMTIAHDAGFATVLSARSGETEDSWLSDLAVGWRTGQIKVGSTTRSERTAKWNRLLRIEAELGDRSHFAGRSALAKT